MWHSSLLSSPLLDLSSMSNAEHSFCYARYSSTWHHSTLAIIASFSYEKRVNRVCAWNMQKVQRVLWCRCKCRCGSSALISRQVDLFSSTLQCTHIQPSSFELSSCIRLTLPLALVLWRQDITPNPNKKLHSPTQKLRNIFPKPLRKQFRSWSLKLSQKLTSNLQRHPD
jgi:hypothetical protein